MMDILEVKKTIRKHITIIKKTLINPDTETIIAIPKNKIKRDRDG